MRFAGFKRSWRDARLTPAPRRDLIAPINDMAATAKAEGIRAHAIIVFRSPGLFRYYLLHGNFREQQMVEDRFEVRPLLRTLAHETRFHLLALSQRHVRLLHCTQHRSEPAIHGGTIPQSLESWLHNRQPDHVLASRSAAGPSVGKMKGVVSGTNVDAEREDEYLRSLLQRDRQRCHRPSTQRHRPPPAGWRGVRARHLSPPEQLSPHAGRAVAGSPDNIPDRTLHQRAMEIVNGTFTEPLRRVMTDIPLIWRVARAVRGSTHRGSRGLPGAVMDLLIAADGEYWGAWNEDVQEVDVRRRREDLLNAAALQTLRHGGRAFVLEESDMPVKSVAAAVFRY